MSSLSDVPHAAPSRVETGSFRDRDGSIFYSGRRVFRCLSAAGLCAWNRLSETEFFRAAVRDGKIVETRLAEAEFKPPASLEGKWASVLEHELIPFVSYPYEWSFGMLKDAALLQLELLASALDEEMIFKDASSFNVQWKDGHPIFIDVLSFEELKPGGAWVGYRQFCQLFLYPLMLQAYKGIPFQPWLRGNLDGIAPEHCRKLFSLRDLFRRGVFLHVFLHGLMQAHRQGQEHDVQHELRRAGFNKSLIQANVKRLIGLVSKLDWNPKRSQWADYTISHSYAEADMEQKQRFVRHAVEERHRRLVFDLGCNVGVFSRIAAKHADCVVAIDADHQAVERLYQSLADEVRPRILPLMMNLADPSPNQGWLGRERHSLTDRGKPELVLCLALIHHLAISANLPVAELVRWLASLEADVIIEFVTRDDAMVQQLLQRKTDNYWDYRCDYFENCLRQFFTIERRKVLDSGTRIMYHAKVTP